MAGFLYSQLCSEDHLLFSALSSLAVSQASMNVGILLREDSLWQMVSYHFYFFCVSPQPSQRLDIVLILEQF